MTLFWTIYLIGAAIFFVGWCGYSIWLLGWRHGFDEDLIGRTITAIIVALIWPFTSVALIALWWRFRPH